MVQKNKSVTFFRYICFLKFRSAICLETTQFYLEKGLRFYLRLNVTLPRSHFLDLNNESTIIIIIHLSRR